jgi:hypothetical protein
MGKRLEDLPVSDTPLAAPEDTRDAEWFRFVEEVGDLRDSGEVDWADETLEGISETVTRTRVVTAGQRQAVANIAARRRSARGPGTRGGSRRYEGWRR